MLTVFAKTDRFIGEKRTPGNPGFFSRPSGDGKRKKILEGSRLNIRPGLLSGGLLFLFLLSLLLLFVNCFYNKNDCLIVEKNAWQPWLLLSSVWRWRKKDGVDPRSKYSRVIMIHAPFTPAITMNCPRALFPRALIQLVANWPPASRCSREMMLERRRDADTAADAVCGAMARSKDAGRFT